MTPIDMISRRRFLETVAIATAVACQSRSSHSEERGDAAIALGPEATLTPHEARWWKALDGKRVQCELCPRNCRVADRERGTCGVRENRDGKYYTLVHSR